MGGEIPTPLPALLLVVIEHINLNKEDSMRVPQEVLDAHEKAYKTPLHKDGAMRTRFSPRPQASFTRTTLVLEDRHSDAVLIQWHLQDSCLYNGSGSLMTRLITFRPRFVASPDWLHDVCPLCGRTKDHGPVDDEFLSCLFCGGR